MNILVVEDEPRVAAFIRRGLAEDGHDVAVTADGKAAVTMAAGGAYDALVLDVRLPFADGFSVTAQLRARGCRTPILMLTALNAREDVVRGLDAGADDYLTKPFDFSELLARIRAIGRRVGEGTPVLRCADVEMDRVRRTASRGTHELRLTPIEYRLLEVLAEARGAPVTRALLLDRVWGMRFDPGTGVIDVHVANLRGKLERGGLPRILRTVKGVGFRLAPTDS